ncbi:MAG TPA: DNA polymerase/3'-5' exonuclease PolX [Bdellovibrionota bacterium]|nr:DNA polymerase/3'-5' exonuclease PolX [Bdellovibrionota bacterium]
MNLQADRHQVAEALEEIAVLLELKGENPFKVRAYSAGARTLESVDGDLGSLMSSGRLWEMKGIGAALKEKITELAQTGKLVYLEKLRKEFPETLFDLLKVQGLGPKKVKVLYEELGIESLEQLEKACRENRLLKLAGFGQKTQEKVLKGIEFLHTASGRYLYGDVIDTAEGILHKMKKWKEIERVSLGGSLRRGKEMVKDVDIVAASTKPQAVMDKFVAMPGVVQVLAHGETKSSVILGKGLQCDLRVVTDKEFPYALHHFTGSKEHNTAMRTRAKETGFKMNEYGLFKGEKLVPCNDEAAIFKALGLAYIPPELREDNGEIEAAERGKIPELIELGDLRGFFHVHSTYSDGRNTLAEMVAAAAEMDIEYIGISEHSQTAFYAGGLKEADIDRQFTELDHLQKKYPKLRIFRGVESDILPDGSLDYPDRVLKNFDFVIGSVHASFNMPEEEMTKRCVRALENPYCTILGHPTGRLLLNREAFKIDLHAIIDRAANLGKIVELNANPYRLDLDWRVVGYAKEKRVRLAIDPDAHDTKGLSDIRFGINMARKGGLTKRDVFNTLPVAAMEKALAQTRTH